MIYDKSYKVKSFKESDEKLQREWELIANTTAFGERHKRNRFIDLYKELLNNDIKAIVFKGMIISELYPSHHNRNYMNEDILIKKENIRLCQKILENNGFERKIAKENKAEVYNYFCPKSGLYLQVHTSLFSEIHHYNNSLKELFRDVYESKEIVNINGLDIYTFSIDKHFMYIIYNAIEDLRKDSIRIRQICDFTMFINTYHSKINWNLIWQEVAELESEKLLVNFLHIAIEYLGLDKNKITYINKKSLYKINTTELLNKILHGGIYGFDYEQTNQIDTLEEIEEENISILQGFDNIKEKYKLFLDRFFMKVN